MVAGGRNSDPAARQARHAQRPLEPAHAGAVDRRHRLHIARGAHRAADQASLFGLGAPRRALAGIERASAAAADEHAQARGNGKARYEIRNPHPHGPEFGPRV